jgi:hypothetical protein
MRFRFGTATSVIFVRHFSSRTILFTDYSEHLRGGAAQMLNMPLIGIAIALIVCAIVARVFAHGQQKADKPQKAEIIRQLLALSERENRLAGTPPSVRSRAPLSNQRTLSGNGPRKAAPNISQPLRSNSPSPKSLTRN